MQQLSSYKIIVKKTELCHIDAQQWHNKRLFFITLLFLKDTIYESNRKKTQFSRTLG
jgi:hypothetical protein